MTSLYLQITLNQWQCSTEALKLKTELTVLYSQNEPKFCPVTATLEDHLGQHQTHRAVLQRGKDTLTSTVKGKAIIQYQIKVQSPRQLRLNKNK